MFEIGSRFGGASMGWSDGSIGGDIWGRPMTIQDSLEDNKGPIIVIKQSGEVYVDGELVDDESSLPPNVLEIIQKLNANN